MTALQLNAPKTLIILAIQFVLAALHIIGPGRQMPGTWHTLYYSYFSDLALPFGFYFLLCLNETQIAALRPWWVKAGLVFGAAASAEILQYFGIYALGLTFDPLDIAAYAAGVMLAAAIERGILARKLDFWRNAST